MKNFADLRILLLQIRDDEETMLEEYLEFVELSGLHEQQFTVLNTFRTPEFSPDCVLDYDALFVGGSSDASVLKPELYPFVHNCRGLIRYCYEHDIPVLASCFGFQLLTVEFGGTIILDEANQEMGLYEITLNDDAMRDPLLNDMPRTFYAVSGHRERAIKLPNIVTPYASSKLCEHHMFKANDKPIYGFQFHPEVTTKDLISRISRYRDRYLKNAEELQAVLDGATFETPESNGLIRKFVERVL